MGALMGVQVSFLNVPLSTERAPVWLLTCVAPLMYRKLTKTPESLRTIGANKTLVSWNSAGTGCSCGVWCTQTLCMTERHVWFTVWHSLVHCYCSGWGVSVHFWCFCFRWDSCGSIFSTSSVNTRNSFENILDGWQAYSFTTVGSCG